MNIFINYRRSDSQYQVDRLFEALSEYLESPDQQLYMDIEATPLGVDYINYIQSKIRESDVFLTVIGDEWLMASDEALLKPRLQNPDDLVRQEIAFALKEDIPVIPTLLDQASFPKSTDLPDDIAALTRRNGVTIRRRTFDEDVFNLAEGLGLTGENRKMGVYFLPPLLDGNIVQEQNVSGKETHQSNTGERSDLQTRVKIGPTSAKTIGGTWKVSLIPKFLIVALVLSVSGFIMYRMIVPPNPPEEPIHELIISSNPSTIAEAKVGDTVKFVISVTNTGNVTESNIQYEFKNYRTGKTNRIAKGDLVPGATFTDNGEYIVKTVDKNYGKIAFSFSISSDVIKPPVSTDFSVAKISERPSEWSPWYNTDRPGGDGDFEVIANMTKLNSKCAQPLAIECRVVSNKENWEKSGQAYNCDLQLGGVCRNGNQPSFSAQNRRVCLDYEARILCPAK